MLILQLNQKLPVKSITFPSFIELDNIDRIISMRILLTFFAIGIFWGFQSIKGQSLSISGSILDNDTKMPLYGAYASIKDSIGGQTNTVMTDMKGKFIITNLFLNHNYLLKISFLGYQSQELTFRKFNRSVNLGKIHLSIQTNVIGEVLIKKAVSLAIQRGDTTEMAASSFKTNPDATADDLIKKMPGITYENGVVKAHGEEVLKILVDGKDFFGDDPSVTLNNFPSDAIDKIQVFDRLSEQAQFTGFDDGQSVKTINIVTKPDRKNSVFGKCYLGTDADSKYTAGGNLHLFNNKTRISFLGLSNNINRQNFSADELAGVSSSKNDGFVIGQQVGVNTTNATGFNLNTVKKKINLTGSYFFNNNNNITNQLILKDKFLAPLPDHYASERDTNSGKKINHRFNFRLEYTIDSSNILIFIPKISLQSGNGDKFAAKKTTKESNGLEKFVNESGIASNNNNTSYNLSNELVYRHKFGLSRRSFSVSIKTSMNNKSSDVLQNGFFRPSLDNIISADQSTNSRNNGYDLSASLVYIEPLSKKSMLYFNYIASYSHTKKDKETYSTDSVGNLLAHIDTLSNLFSNDYTNNRFGVSYKIKSKRIKFSLGADFQHAVNKGQQLYPGVYSVNKPFDRWLPSLLFQVKKNQKNNLKFFYRTSTNEPGISLLQNVIDNSQRSEISIGNPDLLQEYTHALTCNYFFGNPEKKMNYSILLSGKYTLDYIGTQVYTAMSDTILHVQHIDIILPKNNQLSHPVNFDHAINIKSLFSMGLPLKVIGCNINCFTGFNYSQTPGYIGERLNIYHLYNLTDGVQVSSNISERVDFNVTYSWNFNRIINSGLTNFSNERITYRYQVISAKTTNAIGKYWVMQQSANAQIYMGFNNFNQNTLVWNVYLARKVGRSNQGELRFSITDILNQNKNITHNVTPQYVSDANSNTLHRLFMLMFTYNLNTAQVSDSASGLRQKKQD